MLYSGEIVIFRLGFRINLWFFTELELISVINWRTYKNNLLNFVFQSQNGELLEMNPWIVCEKSQCSRKSIWIQYLKLSVVKLISKRTTNGWYPRFARYKAYLLGLYWIALNHVQWERVWPFCTDGSLWGQFWTNLVHYGVILGPRARYLGQFGAYFSPVFLYKRA